MKACASCGTIANQSVRRCLACGSTSFVYVCENCKTRFTGHNCPQCSVPRESHEKVCPNCGKHSFDARCPDCGWSLADVPPLPVEISPEAYGIHAGEGVYTSDEFDKTQQKQKKKESGCGITALVLSLIGYWCSHDIGLVFLVPAFLFFILGMVLAQINNRHRWSLIVTGILLVLSTVMLAVAPAGWGA